MDSKSAHFVRGKFIVFDGIDGAGKSTQIKALSEQLRARFAGTGKRVIVTREPGGTPLGETLRSIVLHHTMQTETQALLMFAARKEHISCVIEPALERGDWVISDRFTDATFAYQGGGSGLSLEKLEVLETWVQGTLRPDLTILLDLPVDIARQRTVCRTQHTQNVEPDGDDQPIKRDSHGEDGADIDQFESQSADFFSRIRATYLARAAQAAHRYCIVDATQSVEVIQRKLQQCLERLENCRFG